jgi:hypothetical protein
MKNPVKNATRIGNNHGKVIVVQENIDHQKPRGSWKDASSRRNLIYQKRWTAIIVTIHHNAFLQYPCEGEGISGFSSSTSENSASFGLLQKLFQKRLKKLLRIRAVVFRIRKSGECC